MKIDLHIHSNYSDGVLSMFQIIDEAVKNKVQIISITDHDSIKVYSKKLFDYAKEKNITLIPGVEISTKYQGFGVHILGYNIDLNNIQNYVGDLKTIVNGTLEEITSYNQLENQ